MKLICQCPWCKKTTSVECSEQFALGEVLFTDCGKCAENFFVVSEHGKITMYASYAMTLNTEIKTLSADCQLE